MIPFCAIPFCCVVGAGILNFLLDCMTMICRIFAESSVAVKMIPGWMTLLFLLLFFGFFQFASQFKRFCCMWAMIILIAAAWVYPLMQDPCVAVIRGGSSGTVTLLYADPLSKTGVIVNLADYERAAAAVNFFERYGIERCSRVYLTHKSHQNRSGMKFLKSKMQIGQTLILEKSLFLPEKDLKKDQKYDMLSHSLATIPDTLHFTAFTNKKLNEEGFYLFTGKQVRAKSDSAEYYCRSVRSLYPELILLNAETLKEIP